MWESLYSRLHSKLQSLHKPIENLEQRLTRSFNTVIKMPAVLPLATLLDSHGGGDHLSAVNQPAMGDSMKQRPKKKKKKKTFFALT